MALFPCSPCFPWFKKLGLTQGLQNFLVLGETPDFLLGEKLIAIGSHDEFATTPFDQFTRETKLVLNRCGQTGRLGQVISFYAVADG